jgi:hypothetical protein
MAEITAGINPFPAKQFINFPLYRFWHRPTLIPSQQELKGNKMETEYTYNSKVDKLIEQSKYILTLKEGWDEEDALPIDKAIWENATSFLSAYVKYVHQHCGVPLELPEINPVRDGSIDLEWRTSRGRLLINFNKKNPQEASFYGDRYADEDSIKGNVGIKEVKEHLAIWMKNCL